MFLFAEPLNVGGVDLTSFLNYGVLGIVVLLLILGLLVPKAVLARADEETKKANADRDAWKTAFDTERQAHTLTREALVRAEERGEAALEVQKTTLALLAELGHGQSPNVPGAPLGRTG